MTIEAMKQALEALETCMYPQQKQIQAITSLRQAIEQAEKQEPVGVVGMDVSRPHMRSLDGQYFGQKPDTKTVMLFKDLEVGTKLYTTPQPQQAEKQEPVAYINVEQRKLEWAKYMKWETPTVVNLPKIPLYTTPQPQEKNT